MQDWEKSFNIKVTSYPGNELIHRLSYQPVLSNCQTIYPQTAGNYKLHHHDDFELIIPFQGAYNCHLDQYGITVQPGHFLLIQPDQSHQDHYTTDAPFRCMHFRIFDNERRTYLKRIFYPGFFISSQIGKIPDNLAKESCDLLYLAAEKRLSETVCNALFQSVFWLLTESFPPESLVRNLSSVTEKNHLRMELCRLFSSFK